MGNESPRAKNGLLTKIAIQILEYQTDMQRCRFDTLGKSPPAHRAGAPTARGQWVCPRAVCESDSPIATAAFQKYQLFEKRDCKIQLPEIHPPLKAVKSALERWVDLWRYEYPTKPTARGQTLRPCWGQFPHRYLPSSLFTTVYSRHKCTGEVKLGLKPVVTTFAAA